jgi:pectin methylesterase-like acyl-CoA thioesterase
MAAVPRAHAATIVWSGGGGADTNWSAAVNWIGGVPGAADDVKLFDAGTNTAPGVASGLVDAAFGGEVGGLQFGATNGWHLLEIAPGQTLRVTGAGGLVVGTPGDVGAARNLTNFIRGTQAGLVVSNPAALLSINQGTAAGVTGTRGNLDLTGLDRFEATLRAIGLGSTVFPNPGNAVQREAGQLALARTNRITLTLTDSLANYETAGRTNALELSRNPGNHAGALSLLWLGLTNALYVDSMGFGRDKASAAAAGCMAFHPALAGMGPVAWIRGAAGDASRVTWWAIGDMNANASSAQVAVGTNDFTVGTVNALVHTLSLARDCSPSHTATATIFGVLNFGAGTINAERILAGNQSLGPASSTAPCVGILNLRGPGTLQVNSELVLGRTTTGSAAAVRTSGQLHVQGGTVLANQISVGAASTNNLITLSNATLIVSNAIASPARALTTLALTNAILGLHVTGATPVTVTNLVTAGANLIHLPAVAVFTTYPTQVTLLKYTTLAGAGFNFNLGTIPASAPGASLSNHVLNSSIDLVLPSDPRPQTTAPSSYSGAPGDTVSFAVTATGAAPLAYQWHRDGTPLTNGPTPHGSTLGGVNTATLHLTNAQPADNGNYAVVITNAFGMVTSAVAVLTISAGDVAPSVTGPTDQTVIQGGTAVFTAAVSGNPTPWLQWRKDGMDLPGQQSATLVLTNVQHPADEGVYSIVATNVAGAVTNSATLTVLVPPQITLQPASLTVTNGQAAGLTVVATGVPGPTFQWRKNGSPIAGATNTSLTFAPATPADIGTYSVVVQNPAGTVTSSNADLNVYSTMTPTVLAPANGATQVCWDTPLRLSFDVPPVLRTPGTGRIRIYNATNPATPVETLDMALNTSPHPVHAANIQSRTIAGQTLNTYPVIITGNTAALYPRPGVLTSNQTYFVTIEPGVFTDAAGAWHAGLLETNAWRFTTRAAVAPQAITNPVVAADGSGDFMTVQGALDYLPATGPTRRIIDIRDGVYTELIVVAKSNLTLRGQSRSGTILRYYNNANMNGSTRTRMSLHVRAPDVALVSLTATNITPKGGSQAEALFLESGSSAARRFIAYDCLFSSYQDTILGNDADTPAYFESCTIQGDTDYIWGGATMYFTNCELKMLSNGGHYANPSSSAGSNGMAFVNCRLVRDPAVTSAFLGRTRGIPNGNAAFIQCLADAHVGGWAADALPTNSFRLWHHGISNLTATVNRDATITNSILLSPGDPLLVLTLNASNWLYGWMPGLAPWFTNQPVAQTKLVGESVTFAAAAAGLPAPAYQWLKDGVPIPGATAPMLTLTNLAVNAAGVYSVLASNAAGVTPSAGAALVISNRPPSAGFFLLPATQNTATSVSTIKLLSVASDPDGDAVAITGVASVSTNGGAASLESGWIHYMPAPGYTGPDELAYTLTDARGAVAPGVLTILISPAGVGFNQLAPPENLGGNQWRLRYLGIPGFRYALEWRTNLTLGDWVPVRTNVAGPEGRLEFTNTSTAPENYYRTRHAP